MGNPHNSRIDTFLSDAANAGDASAQFLLGVMYENGIAIEPNDELAAQWFQRATEQGHVKASIHLASLYQEGKGVEHDEGRAAELYMKAVQSGDENAEEILKKFFHSGDVNLEKTQIKITDLYELQKGAITKELKDAIINWARFWGAIIGVSITALSILGAAYWWDDVVSVMTKPVLDEIRGELDNAKTARREIVRILRDLEKQSGVQKPSSLELPKLEKKITAVQTEKDPESQPIPIEKTLENEPN